MWHSYFLSLFLWITTYFCTFGVWGASGVVFSSGTLDPCAFIFDIGLLTSSSSSVMSNSGTIQRFRLFYNPPKHKGCILALAWISQPPHPWWTTISFCKQKRFPLVNDVFLFSPILYTYFIGIGTWGVSNNAFSSGLQVLCDSISTWVRRCQHSPTHWHHLPVSPSSYGVPKCTGGFLLPDWLSESPSPPSDTDRLKPVTMIYVLCGIDECQSVSVGNTFPRVHVWFPGLFLHDPHDEGGFVDSARLPTATPPPLGRLLRALFWWSSGSTFVCSVITCIVLFPLTVWLNPLLVV